MTPNARPRAFEVIETRAGHRAMLDRTTGEVMHPVLGPRAESEQLYVTPARIRQRLLDPDTAPLRVLDVGLGAGSNACTTLRAANDVRAPKRSLELVSLDRTLDALDLATAEDHAAEFGFDAEGRLAARALIARGSWCAPLCQWTLALGELPGTLVQLPRDAFDVIYWDPFSPAQNPQLWNLAAFRLAHARCRHGATLHTYGGATATRTALLLAGFFVGLGMPLPGGRQGTIASTAHGALTLPLEPRFLARVARSTAPFPADAPPDALAQLEAHPQFQR